MAKFRYCEVCGMQTINVNHYVCRKCRDLISRSKNFAYQASEDEGFGEIDTSVSDKYTEEDNVWKD